MNRVPYYEQDQFSNQYDREEYIRMQRQQLFAQQQREDYENYMRKNQQYIQNMYYDKSGMNTPIKITEDKNYKNQRKILDNANDNLITNLTKENQYTNYHNQYIGNLDNNDINIKPYNQQYNQNIQQENPIQKYKEEEYPKPNYHLRNQNPENYPNNNNYENLNIPPEYIQQYQNQNFNQQQMEIPENYYNNIPEQKYYEYLQNENSQNPNYQYFNAQNLNNENLQNQNNQNYNNPNLQAIGEYPAPKIFPESYIPNSEIIDKYTTEMKNEKIKKQNEIDQMQLPLYQYGKYLKPLIDPLNNNNPNLKPGELPFDRRLEERHEYLENKMKNNATYTNLTHQMTNNISLKSIPLRPINESDKEKIYQMQLKEEKMRKYKESLDNQIRNKTSNTYSKENNDYKKEIPPNPYSRGYLNSNSNILNNPIN